MKKSPPIACFAFAAAVLLPLTAFTQVTSPPGRSDNTDSIRTPPAPPAPRINGPRVYGARPGHPFFYHLPVSGERPITILARGLPRGLRLDSATGNITGEIAGPGEHIVTFTVSNAAGKDSASLRIVSGSKICLTPPLGWNSWNCFNINIDAARIRGAADAMVATGLIDHGWTYINMDDHWEGQRDGAGNIQSNSKIGDVKALADYIHCEGLKIGIYSSPGPVTCGGVVGSWQHEDQDAATFAGWGIDYLKYDWCSYGSVSDTAREEEYAELLPPDKSNELKSLSKEYLALAMRKYHRDPAYLPRTKTLEETEESSVNATRDRIASRLEMLHDEARKLAPDKVAAIEIEVDKEPYRKMRASLDKVNRDIVFSLCQYGMGKVWEWGAATGGNLWRTTNDISANWKTFEDRGFSQNGLEQWAGPGHWNDPDMLEIGNGNLTPDENYTHMTLWCMLSAPLLIGCDLSKTTPFIISLFSNDEVIAVNQDSLGRQGWRARQDGQKEVWMKPLSDGSLAVAFFNRGNFSADVSIQWRDLKIDGPQFLRDLWRQKDLGVQGSGYSVNVAAHGAELFKVSPENQRPGH